MGSTMWSIWWRWAIVQGMAIVTAMLAIILVFDMLARAIQRPGLDNMMLWAYVLQSVVWWGVHARLQMKAQQRDPLRVANIHALLTGRIK